MTRCENHAQIAHISLSDGSARKKFFPLHSWLACSKMLWPTNCGPRGKIENSLALAYNKLPKASRRVIGYCFQYHIYLKLLININAWCIKVTFESKHLSGAFFRQQSSIDLMKHWVETLKHRQKLTEKFGTRKWKRFLEQFWCINSAKYFQSSSAEKFLFLGKFLSVEDWKTLHKNAFELNCIGHIVQKRTETSKTSFNKDQPR